LNQKLQRLVRQMRKYDTLPLMIISLAGLLISIAHLPIANAQAAKSSSELGSRADDALSLIKDALQALIAENARLRKKVAGLEVELNDNKKASIAAAQTYLAEKQKLERSMSESKQALLSSKNDAEEKISELKKQLEDARRAMSAAVQQNKRDQKEKEREISELTSRLEAARADKNALATRHETLARDYQGALSAKQEVESALHETKQKLTETENQAQELALTLEKLTRPQKAQELAFAWEQLAKEVAPVFSQLASAAALMEETNSAADQEIAATQATLVDGAAEKARLADKLSGTRDDIKSVDRAASEMNATFREIETSITRNSEAVAQRESDLKRQDVTVAASRGQLESLATEIASVRGKRSLLQSRADQVVAASEMLRHLSAEADSAVSALTDQLTRLDLIARQDRSALDAEPHRQALGQIQTDVQRSTSAARAAEGLLTQLGESATNLRTRLATLVDDKSELARRVSELQQSLEILRRDLTRLSDEIRGALEPDDGQTRDNRSSLRRLGPGVRKNKRALIALMSDFARMDERLGKIQGDMQASSDSLDRAHAQLAAQQTSAGEAQRAAGVVRLEIESFAQEEGVRSGAPDLAQKVSTSADSVANTYLDQKAEAIRKIDDLLSKLALASRESNERIKRVNDLEAALNTIVAQLDEVMNSLAKQRRAPHALTKRYADLGRRYNTLLHRDKEYRSALAEYEQQASQTLAAIASLQDGISTLQSQLQVATLEDDGKFSAGLLPSNITADLNQRRNRLEDIERRLGVISGALKSERIVPLPQRTQKELLSEAGAKKPENARVSVSGIDLEKKKRAVSEISVQCDRSLPSCRRWMFLKKRQQKNDSKVTAVPAPSR